MSSKFYHLITNTKLHIEYLFAYAATYRSHCVVIALRLFNIWTYSGHDHFLPHPLSSIFVLIQPLQLFLLRCWHRGQRTARKMGTAAKHKMQKLYGAESLLPNSAFCQSCLQWINGYVCLSHLSPPPHPVDTPWSASGDGVISLSPLQVEPALLGNPFLGSNPSRI
jgi:hypothetical protein